MMFSTWAKHARNLSTYLFILCSAVCSYSQGLNHTSFMDVKSVEIRAFDNEIDSNGTDQIVIRLFQPFRKGNYFMITNAVYYEDTEGGYWENPDDPKKAIVAMKIKFIGNKVLYPGDDLTFNIPASLSDNGGLAHTFTLNNLTADNFWEASWEGKTPTPIELDQATYSNLYIFQGTFYRKGAKQNLLGTIIDGLAVGKSDSLVQETGIPEALTDIGPVIVDLTGSIYGKKDQAICDPCGPNVPTTVNWTLVSGTQTNNINKEGKGNDVCYPDTCKYNTTFIITEDSCRIDVATPYPCTSILSYIWQTVEDVPVFKGGGTNPRGNIPTFIGEHDSTYVLIVTCSDSCVLVSNPVTAFCDLQCNATVSVTQLDCTLYASVTGDCPSPSYQWQQDTTGSAYFNISGATSATYETSVNGDFRVVVTGCDNCSSLAASIEAVGCECDCTASLYFDEFDCELELTTDLCDGYTIDWYVSDHKDPSDCGQTVDDCTLVETGIGPLSNTGINGNYWVVLQKDFCDPVITSSSFYVDWDICLDECNPRLDLAIDAFSCEIEASWSGCFDALEGTWYVNTDTTLLGSCDTVTNWTEIIGVPNDLIDGGDGTGEFYLDPQEGSGCYLFELSCGNCQMNLSESIWWEPCEDPCVCVDTLLTLDTLNCDLSWDSDCVNFNRALQYRPEGSTGVFMDLIVSINAQDSFHVVVDGEYRLKFFNGFCDSIVYSNVQVVTDCECDGSISYSKDSTNCLWYNFSDPCIDSIETYKISSSDNGTPGTWDTWVFELGDPPDTFMVPFDGYWQFEIVCANECVYDVTEVFVGCDTMCTCNNPGLILNGQCDLLLLSDVNCYDLDSTFWEFSANGSAPWDSLATGGGTYIPTENGFFRANLTDPSGICDTVLVQEVTCIDECPCTPIISETANCELTLTLNGDCQGYDTWEWQSSSTGDAPWTDEQTDGSIYTTSTSDYFQVVISDSSEDCEDKVSNVEYVQCPVYCDYDLSSYTSGLCPTIIYDFENCSSVPQVSIQYNEESCGSPSAPWQSVSNPEDIIVISDPDGTFQVLFLPEDGTACYRLSLACPDSGCSTISTIDTWWVECVDPCACTDGSLDSLGTCQLGWDPTCPGFTIILQYYEEFSGTWINLPDTISSPYTATMDGDYRLSFTKPGCAPLTTNVQSISGCVPDLCGPGCDEQSVVIEGHIRIDRIIDEDGATCSLFSVFICGDDPNATTVNNGALSSLILGIQMCFPACNWDNTIFSYDYLNPADSCDITITILDSPIQFDVFEHVGGSYVVDTSLCNAPAIPSIKEEIPLEYESEKDKVVLSDTPEGEQSTQTVDTELDAKKKVLKVYPNPTMNRFTLELQSSIKDDGILQLMDITGKQWLNQSLPITPGQNEYQVDVAHIPAGIYLIQVVSTEKYPVERILIIK